MVVIVQPGLRVVVLAWIYSDARSPRKTSFLTPWVRRLICERAVFLMPEDYLNHTAKSSKGLQLKRKQHPLFFFLTAKNEKTEYRRVPCAEPAAMLHSEAGKNKIRPALRAGSGSPPVVWRAVA
jgi:hypothetical protein